MFTMKNLHQYQLHLQWTGNTGQGTSGYTQYERSHSISINGKPTIPGSSDPIFRGDPNMYNPEELLLASLASCHMLWYLHLCAENGIVVTDYTDNPTGTMQEAANGSGRFTEVVLKPQVTVKEPEMLEKAKTLHKSANQYCFIANSVNFAVHHEPSCSARG
jgi:organic hydroperoxide reductase OsmC/OhrA